MSYQIFPFFSFRIPLLPFSGQYIKNDRNALFHHFSNPKIQEAIFLASPVLFRELQKLSQATSKNDKEAERVIHSFTRYLSRMQTRCTPFGLFAGCGVGETGGTNTAIHMQDTCQRKTRLDMLYLYTLYDAILQMPDIREKIKNYPNSSLYLWGKRYRYVETEYLPSGVTYHLSETSSSFHLKKALKIATNGAVMMDLVNCLVSNVNTKEDATEFINDLINAQVLTGELSKSITGNDYFERMVCMIESINDNNRILPILKEIQFALKKIDHGNSGINAYQYIQSLVERIEVPYKEQYLFQVDMIRTTNDANLGNGTIEDLKSALIFLNRIKVLKKNELLDKFRQDFLSRYEEREIPLMEALDTESGLGYPSKSADGDLTPLIENFRLPQQTDENNSYNTNKFQSILYKKAFECLSKGQQEIVFFDDDVKDFTINWNDLPPTIYTIFEIIRSNSDNNLIHLHFFSGSGANVLARFAHADEKMDSFVKKIAEKEQTLTSDYILAEVVHLPEARLSNVLFRPHIRDFEIVYLSSSDMPCEKKLHVSDLLLSVRNNRIILRSKKTGKEIIPWLTTAHVYHFGLPVYRFLCDMQKQGRRYGSNFDWGSYSQNYRPRVRYKNIILSPASWIITRDELKHLFIIQEDDNLLSEIEVWRNQHQIPRYVLMIESDQKLWVDWENALSIRSMFSIIKNHPVVTFTEFLFEPEHAVVRDSDGNAYTNECIAVFYREPE